MKKILYSLLLLLPVFFCVSCLEFIFGPVISETGEYIYVADHDIYRYNLQTEQLEKLTEDGAGANYADPVYMKDQNKIGYRSANGAGFFSMTLDGQNHSELFTFPTGVCGLDYCLSTKKLFMYAIGTVRKLAMVDQNGDNFIYLTNPENYNDARPSINNLGDKILFQSDRTGADQIYLLDLNLNTTTQLTNGSNSKSLPKWAANEMGFYYREITTDNHGIILYYDLADNSTAKIAEFPGFSPFYYTMSPDEDKVALCIRPLTGSGLNLWIYDIENQSLEQKTDLSLIFECPQWYRFIDKGSKALVTDR
ncbi:MAG: hypothetical protein V1681_02320 [Candidatus Neomarinimicrobiota bacterium]